MSRKTGRTQTCRDREARAKLARAEKFLPAVGAWDDLASLDQGVPDPRVPRPGSSCTSTSPKSRDRVYAAPHRQAESSSRRARALERRVGLSTCDGVEQEQLVSLTDERVVTEREGRAVVDDAQGRLASPVAEVGTGAWVVSGERAGFGLGYD